MKPTKQDIISRVTSATMHILHESQLRDTTLWPKNGLKAAATENMDKPDVIEVKVSVSTNSNGSLDNTMRLNMYNKSYARVIKQQKAIEPILDQAVFDGVKFDYKDKADIGLGLDRTLGKMWFTFTIND